MNSVMNRLEQLKKLFVVYIVARAGVDLFLGPGIWRDAEPSRYSVPPAAVFIIGLGGLALVFLIGWWLFSNLPRKKQWARLTLLVLGWLTVFDALTSALITRNGSGFFAWVQNLVPGISWEQVLLLDRVKDILGLFFWGYVIYTLQFIPEIRREFVPGGSDQQK